MTGWLLAAQIAVVVNAPDAAAPCAPVELSVAARVAGTAAPVLALSSSANWQLLRRRISSRVEQDGSGAAWAVSEGTFLVATPATGRVPLPGVVASASGRTARSAPLALLVRDDPADVDAARVLVDAALDTRRGGAPGDTVFVGQQMDYVVTVRLNEAARRRMRRNPTFFPPDMPSVLAYDVEPAAPVARPARQCFESLAYRRALFPLFPGAATIPPAALTYAIPLSASFFSREETHELRTDSVRFVAVEPPATGRPRDFAGAVGAGVQATALLGSAEARMGDPLLVTVRLEGRGNVKLLPRPALAIPWAAVARGAERVVVDSSLGRVRGTKEFDWLLTPRRAGPATIDTIRYPYFDPERGVYDVALTAPIHVAVASASLASADTAVAPRPAIRTRLREPEPPPLTERPAYWLLLALAPIPAAVRRARRGARRRRGTATAAQRLQRAVTLGEPLAGRELRRLWLDAIRERVPALAPATRRVPLARQLRRAGVTEATADAADALLERLDAIAFGGDGAPAAGMPADAARLAGEIDAQAVQPRGGAARALGIVLICACTSAGALLALPEGAARSFDDGVRAYLAGDFRAAHRQFARVAARAPRAADGWANLGTAAWSAGDTAYAVAGWQRALRLVPLDDEVRARLDAVHPGAGLASRGYVPPLPPGALAGLALALWLTAWLALALPPARRPRLARPLAGGSIALAVALLGGALELRDRLDARGLGVLRRSLSLAGSPAPGSASAAAAGVGEVGLVGAREGGWVRVVLDGTRAGWVPAGEVLSLEDAASN
jgi:tetratricopeptide (TPR) repeat protein